MASDAELTDFLVERFSPGELRDLLRRLPTHRPLLPQVDDRGSWQEHHAAMVDAMLRHGLVNLELFAALSARRPAYARQIRALAERFGIAVPPPEIPRLEAPPATAPSQADHIRFRDMVSVQRGHHGEVWRVPASGTTPERILKRFDAKLHSAEAQRRLRAHDSPALLGPLKTWREADALWQEYPFVEGVKLSRAVRHGRLEGWLLQQFCDQMHGLLNELAQIGVIHRDVHPDNVFVHLRRISDTADRSQADGDDRSIYFGSDKADLLPLLPEAFRPFMALRRLDFVLMDADFAVTEEEGAQCAPVSHGDFTAPEAWLLRPTCLSDLYSLGATIYFATHRKAPPSIAAREAGVPLRTAPVVCPNIDFRSYLNQLLSLEPWRRPSAPDRLAPRTDKLNIDRRGGLGQPRFLLRVDRTQVLLDAFPAPVVVPFRVAITTLEANGHAEEAAMVRRMADEVHEND